VKVEQIRRGNALTAAGGWADVSVADVRLTRTGPPAQAGSPVRTGAPPGADALPRELILHVGSAAVPVRTRPLGDSAARLVLRSPLPLHIGDRGLLRDPGAGRVASGVVVLDPMPPPLQRRGAARQRAADLATVGDQPDLAAEVRRRGAVRRSDLVAAGVPDGVPESWPSVITVGGWLVDDRRWRSWAEQLGPAVDTWDAGNPMAPGLPRPAAAAALAIPDEAMVDALAREVPGLLIEGPAVHRRGVVPAVPAGVARELDALVERLAAAPFDAPEAGELVAAGLAERYLSLAVRDGRLTRIAAGVYLRPDAVEVAVQRLSAIEQPFTLSQARVALDTTRRIAVPLLELMDRTRRTVRVDRDHHSGS
jgi:selenocysteine-specific elongation factor